MGRQKSGKSKSSQTSATEVGERTPDLSEWTDEAAKARTIDDPRRMPPRDSTGLPSSGDRYTEDPRDR
ncbi:hypothetical protein [Plantactinospora soyae]|uniref:Uncharacterized protein n=1 Tax=Plantactinospora soyae TaxID=1544732 RepID=A0A927QXF5_9ACTN|nr:hypothetical protein [Plantactinospora soyae]MBE1485428.1 hypothetical protein [Plantactinospora soyae]